MATLYALPVLVNWTSGTSTALGWAFSSGGAGASVTPTANDDVIFDNNSGPARTISTVNALCGSLTIAANANALNFSGGLQTNGSTVTLRANTTMGGTLYMNAASKAVQFTNNGATIGNLTANPTGTGASVTCTDNIWCDILSTAGVGSVTFSGLYNSWRSVNLTNNGNVTFPANQIIEVYGGSGNLWNCGSTTTLSVDPTHMIKFIGNMTVASTTTFNAARTYGNVWFNTSGTLVNNLSISNLNCLSIRIFPGAYLKIAAGTSIWSTKWQVEGLKSNGVVFAATTSAALYNTSLTIPAIFQHTYFESGYSVTNGPIKSIYTPPGSTLPSGMVALPINSNFGSFF